eukprot:TRINITY_DN1476_c0_g1_i2.p1 TRINITY_DN1476_c0_g1~~TRINITY_DN1476_c0_g1_i2.p1  ORF type:complete len:629 (-),score=199.29 TRINITY_DN1476_c0_g1_i2:259-2145(-)
MRIFSALCVAGAVLSTDGFRIGDDQVDHDSGVVNAKAHVARSGSQPQQQRQQRQQQQSHGQAARVAHKSVNAHGKAAPRMQQQRRQHAMPPQHQNHAMLQQHGQQHRSNGAHQQHQQQRTHSGGPPVHRAPTSQHMMQRKGAAAHPAGMPHKGPMSTQQRRMPSPPHGGDAREQQAHPQAVPRTAMMQQGGKQQRGQKKPMQANRGSKSPSARRPLMHQAHHAMLENHMKVLHQHKQRRMQQQQASSSNQKRTQPFPVVDPAEEEDPVLEDSGDEKMWWTDFLSDDGPGGSDPLMTSPEDPADLDTEDPPTEMEGLTTAQRPEFDGAGNPIDEEGNLLPDSGLTTAQRPEFDGAGNPIDEEGNLLPDSGAGSAFGTDPMDEADEMIEMVKEKENAIGLAVTDLIETILQQQGMLGGGNELPEEDMALDDMEDLDDTPLPDTPTDLEDDGEVDDPMSDQMSTTGGHATDSQLNKGLVDDPDELEMMGLGAGNSMAAGEKMGMASIVKESLPAGNLEGGAGDLEDKPAQTSVTEQLAPTLETSGGSGAGDAMKPTEPAAIEPGKELSGGSTEPGGKSPQEGGAMSLPDDGFVKAEVKRIDAITGDNGQMPKTDVPGPIVYDADDRSARSA